MVIRNVRSVSECAQLQLRQKNIYKSELCPPPLFCSVVFFYLFFDQNKGSG